jgi:hypothetical protein
VMSLSWFPLRSIRHMTERDLHCCKSSPLPCSSVYFRVYQVAEPAGYGFRHPPAWLREPLLNLATLREFRIPGNHPIYNVIPPSLVLASCFEALLPRLAGRKERYCITPPSAPPLRFFSLRRSKKNGATDIARAYLTRLRYAFRLSQPLDVFLPVQPGLDLSPD